LEDGHERFIERLVHEAVARANLEQRHDDAHRVAASTHAPLDDMPDAERAADLPDVASPAPVAEGRGRGVTRMPPSSTSWPVISSVIPSLR
jgi:hypothetical protein